MGAGAIAAMNIIFALLDRAAQIQQLIQTARAEGRDVTSEELNLLAAQDDASRMNLGNVIKGAQLKTP